MTEEKAPDFSKLQKVDLPGLSKDLAENMPPITPGALEETDLLRASLEKAKAAMPEKKSEGGTAIKGMTDEKGLPFDPAIHCADANGQPELNAHGWLKRKRGGVRSSAPVQDAGQSSETAAPVEAPKSNEEIAAQGTVATYFQTGSMFVGPEFNPPMEWDDATLAKHGLDREQTRMLDFRADLEKNLTKVFFKYGTPADLPPEVGLCLALGTHLFFTFRLQGPKEKAKGFWTVIKAKWKGWRAYKSELKKGAA